MIITPAQSLAQSLAKVPQKSAPDCTHMSVPPVGGQTCAVSFETGAPKTGASTRNHLMDAPDLIRAIEVLKKFSPTAKLVGLRTPTVCLGVAKDWP